MKKGFTLIELLAVIVILGILSVLIVPKIVNTLDQSEQKTNMASARGLLKAAEYKYQDNEIKGINENITIDYTTNTNTNYLDYTGQKPDKGQVTLRQNGQIAIAVKIGNNCYLKNYNSLDITVTPYNENTCGKSTNIVTTGDGLYESTTEPGRLIYRGESPNNWIWIDENGDEISNKDENDTQTELYRIVSYEVDGTIKVIRNERISKTIKWDKANERVGDNNSYCLAAANYGCNVWGSSSTTLYNGEPLGNYFHYISYTTADSTILENVGEGKVETESTLNQYLNSKIANSDDSWQPAILLDKYIDNHYWNVGGIYYTNEDKGIIKEKEEEKQLQWLGKIAILNITEYAEASTNPSCTSAKSGTNSYNMVCKESNWLLNDYYQMSLTPNSETRYQVWIVNASGFFQGNIGSVMHGRRVRPAFYLKSNVKLGGLGTTDEPYYIIES